MKLLINSFSSLLSSVMIMALLISCSSGNAYLRQKYQESPVVTIQYWGNKWKAKPLQQRIAPAPEPLILRIRMDNELSGFSERPVAAEPSPEFYEALKSITLRLPEPIKRLAEERVIGIFIVNNLGSSGYTETVRDEDGNDIYAIMVFDRNVLLQRTANEWATWKENSVFQPKTDGLTTLHVKIETKENDTTANAIRFILLHELGHAMGMASLVHPPWDDSNPAESIGLSFPKLSWRINKEGKIVSLFDDAFPERTSIRYYSFEKSLLSNDQISNTYTNMREYTNFPSLQAAASQWEDFAESFATYFHVVLEKRPWQVIVETSSQSPLLIDSCWNESRCFAKKTFMQKWFAEP
jgi:hypothetical protein